MSINSGIGSYFLAASPNTLRVCRAPLEVVAGRCCSCSIKVEFVMYNVISRRALIGAFYTRLTLEIDEPHQLKRGLSKQLNKVNR